MKKRILLEQKLLFAKELVRRQSTAEDAKAFEDILIINDLYVKKGDSSFNPFREDDRVRREYPIIELLEIWNKNKICSCLSSRHFLIMDKMNTALQARTF